MAGAIDHVWLEAFFEREDSDGDGGLGAEEVVAVLKALGLDGTSDHVQSLFERFDADGSGEISFAEFEPFVKFLCAGSPLPALRCLLGSPAAENESACYSRDGSRAGARNAAHAVRRAPALLLLRARTNATPGKRITQQRVSQLRCSRAAAL